MNDVPIIYYIFLPIFIGITLIWLGTELLKNLIYGTNDTLKWFGKK